jgi:hypothetical protein
MCAKKTGQELTFAKGIYAIADYTQRAAGLPVKKDRKLLQMIGMWGREQDPYIWVKNVEKEIEETYSNLFVGDLRFLNEFAMLKKNGFLCVKIERDEAGIGGDHISEVELDSLPNSEWDYVLSNNESLDVFYAKLDAISKNLGTHV